MSENDNNKTTYSDNSSDGWTKGRPEDWKDSKVNSQPTGQAYSDLGNQIRDSVLNAVTSGDFSGLSDAISQSVFTVLGGVGDSLSQAAGQALSGGSSKRNIGYSDEVRARAERARAEARATAERYHREQEERIRRNREMRAARVQRPNQANLVKYNGVGKVSGILSVIGGSAGVGIATLTCIGAAVAIAAGGGALPALIIGGVFLALFGGLIASGINKISFESKAKQFKKIASEKMYCAVDDIAAATGMDRKKVVKNIKKMLAKGFFPEGHLDDENTTFMVSNSVYEEYMDMKKSKAEQAEKELEEAGVNSESKTRLSPAQQAELSTMMKDGQNSIKRLHELNDEIPGKAISNKLDTMEGLLNDILNRVKEHPDQMNSCHKLMNYYIPTMLKLVEAYAEYDKVKVPGQDIINAKDEIEKTLDTINEAFVQLLNRLFQDSVWDVTADAKVLKTMLQQEGLAEDDLNNNKPIYGGAEQ